MENQASEVILTSQEVKPNVIHWAMAGVAILAVGIAIGLLMGKYIYTPKPTPSPIVSASPTPTSDPTANWKTYRNETAGYSLKYPADMLVFCNYPNTKGLRLWQAPFDCPNGNDIFYEIAVIENLPGEYKEYKKPSSARQINIDGMKATEKTYVYENTDGPLQSLGQSTEILIDNNGYTIQIQLLGNSLDKKNLFDQILSTFKFLEQTTLIPADLQTQVAGVCAPVSRESIVVVTIPMDNVPQPRCVHVTSNQKLKIINNSQGSININVGEIQTSLVSTQSFQFPKTLGEFLAPGGHSIFGAEIWLK